MRPTVFFYSIYAPQNIEQARSEERVQGTGSLPEVWGSVYDIRNLLDSTVKLMDGRSPLEMELPGPLNMLKKPLLKKLKGTVIEKVLRDHDVIRDGMI